MSLPRIPPEQNPNPPAPQIPPQPDRPEDEPVKDPPPAPHTNKPMRLD
ncbi:MAG: hypothetical protein V4634_04150 [Pseudomonadota bacterium]